MKNELRLWMVLLTAALLGLGSCVWAEVTRVRKYHGQVLDIDTRTPLPRTVAVFIWERPVYSPVTNRVHVEIHAVTEVLTDSDGRFEVSATPEAAGDTVEVRLTDPIFFKPGYFLLYKVQSKGEPLRDPAIIYLKRADDPLKALEGLSSDYPFSRTPMFLKALNEERTRLGLPPIRPAQN